MRWIKLSVMSMFLGFTALLVTSGNVAVNHYTYMQENPHDRSRFFRRVPVQREFSHLGSRPMANGLATRRQLRGRGCGGRSSYGQRPLLSWTSTTIPYPRNLYFRKY